MTRKIRAVIFDYGNVLCPMPQPSEFEFLARAAGIESSPFVESLWRHRLDYDRGTFDGPAYWRKIAGENGITFSDGQIRKLIETDLTLWTRPSPIMLAWARDLHRGGVKTSILSNMPRDFSAYLRLNAGWMEDFDTKIFSGELGVVKPDAKIYHACLQGLAVYPEEALFIDDVAANVTAAQSLGIESIMFESVAQLAADVGQFELPVRLVADVDVK